MVTFLIIRHGYSFGNRRHIFSGHLDHPLEPLGHQQAEATADYVLQQFRVDAVYASDLSRVRDTVQPIADRLRLPILFHPGLREVDTGAWSGLSSAVVQLRFPESHALYQKTPGLARFDGGESFTEAQQRVETAITEIAAKNEGRTVVIGTHGGLIRALQAAWQDIPLSRMQEIPFVSNASITVVEYENGRANWLQTGCCAHLAHLTQK